MKTYKDIKNRKIGSNKNLTGDDLETAKAEFQKMMNCGISNCQIAKLLGVSKQAITHFKKNGFISPHSALIADKVEVLGVTKERLRPDITKEQWETLGG